MSDDLDALTKRKYKDREVWWLASDSGAWDGPHREFDGLRDKCLEHCKKRDVIITAGGCLGLYPMLWAESFTKVITFEPCPRNFRVLEMNCDSPRIERYNAALGNSTEEIVLYRHGPGNVGTHSTARAGGEPVRVKQMRIDDLQLDALDLISLDTEGAETFIIQGGLNMIERFHPVISVETVDYTLRDILTKRGYQLVGRNVSDSIFA